MSKMSIRRQSEKSNLTISKVPAQRTIDSVKELRSSDKHVSERHGIGIRDNI